jgi:trimethylamine--corrinoid protein Co-methyltransferase
MDFTPGYCDMHSMIFGYAGPERFSLMSARVQLISEYYGCPSGVHGGKTNSCVPGVQSGVEKVSTMLAAVLAGAIGFGTVGHLENALTFSPLQLVMDNEIAHYVRRCVRGIEVNQDTLAADVIQQVGINGSFISTEHTADHFRDELMISQFFNVSSWGVEDSLNKERFEELARQKVECILSKEQPPILTPEQEAAIDEIVLEASMQTY